MTPPDHDSAGLVYVKLGLLWLGSIVSRFIDEVTIQHLMQTAILIFTVLQSIVLWNEKILPWLRSGRSKTEQQP